MSDLAGNKFKIKIKTSVGMESCHNQTKNKVSYIQGRDIQLRFFMKISKILKTDMNKTAHFHIYQVIFFIFYDSQP